MKKSKTYWVNALLIFLIISFLYGTRVYNSFFETVPGFAYDPTTDRLFSVELKPSINTSDKWSYLIPFKSRYFLEIGHTEFRGKLAPLIKEIEADQKLRKNSPKAYVEKQRSELEASFSNFRSKPIDLWWIAYFPRHDLDSTLLIPEQLSILKQYVDKDSHGIIAADITVVHNKIPALESLPEDKDFLFKAPSTELIREVLLIRGRAAYRLIEFLNY